MRLDARLRRFRRLTSMTMGLGQAAQAGKVFTGKAHLPHGRIF